jgi:hypothetical protein
VQKELQGTKSRRCNCSECEMGLRCRIGRGTRRLKRVYERDGLGGTASSELDENIPDAAADTFAINSGEGVTKKARRLPFPFRNTSPRGSMIKPCQGIRPKVSSDI